MKAYRMVTPKDADPETLRWVADHCVALAKDANDTADAIRAASPESARVYYGRAKEALNLAASMRARAGRIEGKQRRARKAGR